MRTHRTLVLGVIAASAVAVGSATTPTSAAVAPQTLAAASSTTSLAMHPGKLLASNCFQCHGTNGVNGQFDSLAGKSASELFNELKELQTKPDADKAIMKVHALGYTDEQLRLIADFFANVQTGR
ncbi:MAG TPA: hypothetical protein P5181_09445 [Dermatophilaceae bacterium]|nr:hypothetical protein [Dermatophilaceae bacterium]